MTDPIDRCGYGPLSTGDKDPFKMPCAMHDKRYVDKLISQYDADQEFYNGMAAVVRKERTWYKRAALISRMALYSGVVGALGWIFYNT